MTLVNSDFVQTPSWLALDIIEFFNPTGTILDPCRGENRVFFDNLPEGSDWCEITDGVDFFNYHKKVNWIIGNPPYSIFSKWMKHSYDISNEIVYLLPTFKVFNALGLVRMYKKFGWIKHVWVYDVGNQIYWVRSRPIVAVHFSKGYSGDTSWSWFK